jgi:hypothetical protein
VHDRRETGERRESEADQTGTQEAVRRERRHGVRG